MKVLVVEDNIKLLKSISDELNNQKLHFQLLKPRFLALYDRAKYLRFNCFRFDVA